MSRFTVVIVGRAERQVQTIDAWWRQNRHDVPDLFAEEFAAVVDRIADAPSCGSPYAAPLPESVRRILLRRTRYHVYYTIDDQPPSVTIRAVWHTSRGTGPALR